MKKKIEDEERLIKERLEAIGESYSYTPYMRRESLIKTLIKTFKKRLGLTS